jgi:hypothetical protein
MTIDKSAMGMLKAGDFNYMSQERQSDDSVVVTVIKRGDKKVYRAKVKNLNTDKQEVISEENT